MSGLVGGVSLALSLPPFDVWPLAWVALTPVFLAVGRASRSDAALAGVCLGLPFMASSFYGVFAYHTGLGIALQALLPIWSVAPLTFIRAAGLLEKGVAGAFGAAGVWLATDLLLEELLSLPIGIAVTQARGSAPREIARIVGAASIVFLLVACNILLSQAIVHMASRRARKALGLLTLAALLPTLASLPGVSLDASQGPGGCEQMAILQPSVRTEDVERSWWDPRTRARVRERFWEALQRSEGADFVIWPEGSGALESMRFGPAQEEIRRAAGDGNRHLFVSAIDFDEEGRRYNSLFHFDSSGIISRYDKVRPVPWAEREVTPGKHREVLEAGTRHAGLLICFESCFPRGARTLASEGADLLLVSTNNDAFGTSNLPELHLSKSILRAVESGIPVIHASNAGPSAVIGPDGELLARSRLMEEAEMRGCLPHASEFRPHVWIGFLFRYGAALTGVVALALGFAGKWASSRSRLLGIGGALAAILSAALVALGLASSSAAVIAARSGASDRSEPVASRTVRNTQFPSSDTPIQVRRAPAYRPVDLVAGYYGGRVSEQDGLPSPLTLDDTEERARILGMRTQRVDGATLENEILPVVVEVDTQSVAVLERRGIHVVVYTSAFGFWTLPEDELEEIRGPALLRVRPPTFEP